jgi:hypothetical protein
MTSSADSKQRPKTTEEVEDQPLLESTTTVVQTTSVTIKEVTGALTLSLTMPTFSGHMAIRFMQITQASLAPGVQTNGHKEQATKSKNMGSCQWGHDAV